MKHTIIVFIVLFISNSLFAQFSVHLNYSEPTKAGIGIGYDFSKRFWGNLTLSRGIIDDKMDAESTLDRFSIYSISADFSVNYNVIAKEHHDIYLGIGGLVNFDELYAFFTVPVGLRVRPFERLDKIAFTLEVQPAINNGDSYLFGSLGIYYCF
ncbi:hypothetical protein FACS1894145_2520 [Bacteroidia bacterium]|nr:hypothetical protein FACS1894145_2520 [Bacteroidia bacterium]